jgi:hypothetical protein
LLRVGKSITQTETAKILHLPVAIFTVAYRRAGATKPAYSV